MSNHYEGDSGLEAIRKKRRKKRILIVILSIAVLGALLYGTWFYFAQKANHTGIEEGDRQQLQGMPGGVIATGTTAVGMNDIEMNFEFLDAKLMVEKLYAESSDEVKKGDPILKLTDDSLKEATRELERSLMSAQLACRQGEFDHKTGIMEAKAEYDKAAVNLTFAQKTYDNTVAQSKMKVDKAQDKLLDAQELYDEYVDATENDYYYKDYEVAEKKAAYEKNVQLFFEKLEDYGYEIDDEDGDNIYEKDPENFKIEKKRDNRSQSSDGEETVLKLLKTEYQKNKEEYDKAVDNYDNALKKAKAGLEAARDKVLMLTLEYQEQQIQYEKEVADAEAQLEETQILEKNAKATYDTTVKSLDEKLEQLREDSEEAEENYEQFMALMGDGCIYAQTDGTIIMMRASEYSELPKEGILMAYSDTSKMTVTASVDQSGISKLSIGDAAVCDIKNASAYKGKITAINPQTTSTSKASVSYMVTVELEGDISKLSQNQTATVYFGEASALMDRKNGKRNEYEKPDEDRKQDENVKPDEDRKQDENVKSDENRKQDAGTPDAGTAETERTGNTNERGKKEKTQ